MNKKHVIFFLIVISLISLGFKLQTVDFTVLPVEDTYGYVLRGMAHNNGDFTEHPRKTLGWSIFISPFFDMTDSNNFLAYVNIARVLGLMLSIIAIIPMYLLSRKFFDAKYSICAAGLFAFEPHLNHVSGLGMTEPLYILVIILSLYFILNKNSNYSYLSFLTIGLLWWIRWNGIVMLLITSIIFFTNFKRTPKLFLKYFACLAVCLIVVSPMLIERNDQYGSPLFFSQNEHMFMGDYATIVADNMMGVEYSAFNYVDDHGFGKFIEKFVFLGIYNLLFTLFKMSLPYLIFFLPFGILFSLRSFDQEKKYIRSNWILILISLATFVFYFAIVPEKRLIYYVYPFLIILATISLHRLIEYGLSTFSFNEKNKKICLVGIMCTVIILSGLYTLRYATPDPILSDEEILFAETLENNFNGKILDAGYTLKGLYYAHITEPEGVFKEYKISQNPGAYYMFEFNRENVNLMPTILYATSFEDFIDVSYEYELNYISINGNGPSDVFYPYLNEIYENEAEFPYLIKVFDTETEEGFEKLRVKVFEIDYEIFYELYN
ncbi:MAG: glycosyltransferase family 39 protein [Pelagibacterales bacterium]|nr:glycosyltransferase family 39 protein [Pelagibacterales bacterium]